MIDGNADKLITFLLKAMKECPDKMWTLSERRKKRSLRQNAYYWALVSKIAIASKETAAAVHNMNLRAIRKPMIIDGKCLRTLIPDTEEAERKALNMETVHLAPTNQTAVMADGVTYRTYIVMDGSSSFKAEEFVRLIDLAEQDAKALGIDTMTPDERARMLKDELQAQEIESDKHQRQGKNHSHQKG